MSTTITLISLSQCSLVGQSSKRLHDRLPTHPNCGLASAADASPPQSDRTSHALSSELKVGSIRIHMHAIWCSTQAGENDVPIFDCLPRRELASRPLWLKPRASGSPGVRLLFASEIRFLLILVTLQ